VRGGVLETWFEVQIRERWVVAYRLQPEKGYIWPTEMRLVSGRIDQPRRAPGESSPCSEPPQITSRLLRELRVANHMDLARDALAGDEAGPDRRAITDLWGFLRAEAKPPSKAGRKPKEDRYYALLAARYVELVDAGSRRPLKDLEEQSHERGAPYSKDFFRDEIHEARRRGLLTKVRPGEVGGELTQMARRLLRAAGDP
jgi:hypothetical protein